MVHLNPLISDLALILGVAGPTTVLFKWLKQPVVLGYIVAGFLCSGNFLLEGVSNVDNVNIWAEIGIIFLLFSLGLEFSFKKLLDVGGSSLITALVIIVGMMCTGYMAGRLLGWSTTNCVFLGGMLSMSSTTIIIKAFSDLGLRNRKFTTQVFGVLIVEDLFAVVMLVMLSTIFIQKTVHEMVLVEHVFKLVFFLVAWFVVGIYLIPTLLKRIQRFLNAETLLIIALGLCLGMVVLANYAGFSSALGAFVMGSILAGTEQVKSIEKVTMPVKDLFGAVFFVSVGMLVEPALLWEYLGPILFLTGVVILGQIFYATLGFLLSGQELRIALQSSFSLAQIGEFAFIIAALGLSMGVTGSFLYPVAVAVSVITTFTTPFIMKLSEPTLQLLNRKLPPQVHQILSRYSASSQNAENQSEWKLLLKKSLLHIGIYSVILGGVVWIARSYYMPFVEDHFPGFWGNILATTTTILFMMPLLWGLGTRQFNRKLFRKLWKDQRFNRGLLVAIVVLRLFLVVMFFLTVMVHLYSYRWGTLIGIVLLLILMLIFWKRLKKAYLHFEYQFRTNLSAASHNKITPIDKQSKFLHLANLVLSPDSPYVGRTLRELDLRMVHGVTVVSILRGSQRINTPHSAQMLMPGDSLAVVGTDAQLKIFASNVEVESVPSDQQEVTMSQLAVTPNSPFVGITVEQFAMMYHDKCLVIGIEREDGTYVEPLSLVRLHLRDLVWVAGDMSQIRKIKKLN